jgi:hypothetical protein
VLVVTMPLPAVAGPGGDRRAVPGNPTFRISGTMVNAEGARVRPRTALLVEPNGGAGAATTVLTTDRDGSFTILDVPAGDYILLMDGTPLETLIGRPVQHYASLPIRVSGDLDGFVVLARPAVALAGEITFDAGTEPVDLSDVRVSAVAEHGSSAAVSGPIGSDGRFTLDDVHGTVLIEVLNLPRGYTVHSALIGGVDVTGRSVDVAETTSRILRVVLMLEKR